MLAAVITDSGTVVEETAVLQVPSPSDPKATERHKSTIGLKRQIRSNCPGKYPFDVVYRKLEITLWQALGTTKLGDGKGPPNAWSTISSNECADGGFRLPTNQEIIILDIWPS